MKRFLLFLSLALIPAGIIAGQTGSSSKGAEKKVVLTGTVYDPNGSVIAGGEVVARSFGVKEYRATTNDQGIYKIELPLDVYKIEVSAEGFCPRRVELFRVVRSSTPVRSPLNFVLDVAEGDQPCRPKSQIKKEPEKPERKIRKPEIFRSIAE